MALYGRSSSHFTRVTRIFAAELGLAYEFRIVPDLMVSTPAAYGGNPALRLPTLATPEGHWFGALNICRELWRRSSSKPEVEWPEHLTLAVSANAQELVTQAMSTEVALIMAKLSGVDPTNRHYEKNQQSLLNMLAWLEDNAPEIVGAPLEKLRFLEVTLFCLVDHLSFRDVVPIGPYSRLNEFCQRFAKRASAQATPYRFDP